MEKLNKQQQRSDSVRWNFDPVRPEDSEASNGEANKARSRMLARMGISAESKTSEQARSDMLKRQGKR